MLLREMLIIWDNAERENRNPFLGILLGLAKTKRVLLLLFLTASDAFGVCVFVLLTTLDYTPMKGFLWANSGAFKVTEPRKGCL